MNDHLSRLDQATADILAYDPASIPTYEQVAHNSPDAATPPATRQPSLLHRIGEFIDNTPYPTDAIGFIAMKLYKLHNR